jgi:Family of unknown function (DUF5996)
MDTTKAAADLWPALPLSAWKDTCETLHMWSQIVGKLRLELCPMMNHWWEVALYVNAVGLTTSPIPYARGIFEVQFDFLKHQLLIQTSRGEVRVLPLVPCTVAEFYHRFMDALHSLGIEAKIWPVPVEVRDPIPFETDTKHAAYDGEYAQRFWRILVSCDTVLKRFRGQFSGKASPVHFFWGSFDLALTFFSGRRAPERPGADPITREAYSHEVISFGFWPGSGAIQDAAFYAYAAPEPTGFAQAKVRPPRAFYQSEMRELIVMYEDVRRAPSPESVLLDFLQSTYESGANLGNWNRSELERAAA